MIEFVITGVHDQTSGSVNPQPNTVGDGMADVEKLHIEWTDLDRFASVNVDQFSFFSEVAAVEFISDQSVI